MRLAACALSAVLLSGCSWLGMGGGYDDVYGYDNYGYGYGYQGQGQAAYQGQNAYMQGTYAQGYNDCAPQAQPSYQLAQQAPAQVGCAPGQGYAVSGAGGYGAQGQYGQAGQYGQTAQYGMGGYHVEQGAGGYAGGAYGTQTTTLGAEAPYGAALRGGQGGYHHGQAGNVQTMYGGPVYVQGPAGTYGGMGLRGPQNYGAAGCCGGGSMPFGLEVGIGTGVGLSGDVATITEDALGHHKSEAINVAYKDAFKPGVGFDVAATYDLNRNTTLIGRVGYAKSKGQNVHIGDAINQTNGVTTAQAAEYGEFSDLKQLSIEGGVRQYVGRSNLRPYVGATAGAIKTDEVTLTKTSDLYTAPSMSFSDTYIEGGWTPTASGVVGAEMAVGGRAAVGVETGIRWTNGLKTASESTDRWSIPVRLRGRVSF